MVIAVTAAIVAIIIAIMTISTTTTIVGLFTTAMVTAPSIN